MNFGIGGFSSWWKESTYVLIAFDFPRDDLHVTWPRKKLTTSCLDSNPFFFLKLHDTIARYSSVHYKVKTIINFNGKNYPPSED